ncbi:MAG: DUF4365 domain-containing protein [Pseudoruegeria sp.]
MPKRSISQRIGDQAEHIAQGAFLNAPNWICRAQTHDFGVDLEAELTTSVNGVEEMSGAILKLQVKGTLKPIRKDNGFQIRLKTDYLSYANQFRIPVVLLLVNVMTGKTYFLWLQEYLVGREEILSGANSVLVRVPEENELQCAYPRVLPDIALGVTEGAQLMAVQRLFEVFSAKYDQKALELSGDLLEHLSQGGHVSHFNNTVDKLVKRGPHLSRVDSQEFGKILMDLTRRFGDRMNVDHVLKMIIRNESFSWARLDGLSELYDAFPDHAASLNLPELFDSLELHELSWYSQFREANAGLNSIQIWNRISKLDTSFETGMGIPQIPDEDREHCYLKWPNRADMV